MNRQRALEVLYRLRELSESLARRAEVRERVAFGVAVFEGALDGERAFVTLSRLVEAAQKKLGGADVVKQAPLFRTRARFAQERERLRVDFNRLLVLVQELKRETERGERGGLARAVSALDRKSVV